MKTRKTISLVKFMQAIVKAAAMGHNQSDVARQLGISQPAVCLRIQSLIRKGVKVPDIRANSGWYDSKMKPADRLAAAYR